MNVVKFNEKKQNQMKSLSNVISIIGKIGRIVLMVAIPFIILTMVILPYIINNVEVNNDSIEFKTNNIKIVEDKIELFNVVMFDLEDSISNNQVINVLNENSKYEIIGCLEAGMLFALVNIIIMIIILKYVEKLFDNIKNNSTPFIMDNVTYIKKISYLMIALIIINPISGILFNLLVPTVASESGIELISILEILIIFSMSYIFEYGYEIQKDSKGIMYNK